MTARAIRSFGHAFRRGMLAACLGAAGLAAVAGGASAQFYDREVEAVLPPRAVVWQLSRQGFTALSHPRFDGVAYVVDAESAWGNRVRLFVDARNGAIMDRERLEAPLYPPGRVGRPGYGWTEDEVAAQAPRPDTRVARSAPDAAPTNPFASNYPSRPPAPAETRTANPYGLNPEGPASARRDARPPAPRRTAKLAPPKPAPAVPSVTRPEATPTAIVPAAAAAQPQGATLPVQNTAPVPAKPIQQEASTAPQRQVRIIEGVTPMQGAPAGGAASSAPATEKPAEASKAAGAPE